MSFQFRSYAQIAEDVREWSRRLPDDLVAICGIPRSGTILAGMLAEFRHIHLVEYAELRQGATPWTKPHRRKIPAKPREGRVLVLDDTCWKGRTMKQARAELPADLNLEYGALYFGTKGRPYLDHPGRRVRTFHHTFEYNMLRDCLTERMLFDMDGVLCEDWGKPDCGPEWEPRYQQFLETVRPLYRPCYKIGGIVTGRMERHRATTELWLRQHGVEYGELNMASFPDEHARQRYGHARYKSEIYVASSCDLFVESDRRQAREIYKRSGKPVLCVETMTLLGGLEPDPWPELTTIPAVKPNDNSDAPILGPLQVVISYFDGRPIEKLHRLICQLRSVDPGWPVKLQVVVNQIHPHEIPLPPDSGEVDVCYRENRGYNIGAWDHGWRNDPRAEAFLFLQDECRPVRTGWALAYVQKLSNPNVGLVGERLNPRWNRPWPELSRRFPRRDDPEHLMDGQLVDRVSCYQQCFREWGIEPGQRGDHLQALILAARRPVLEAIQGFNSGRNKGEAIAAEIGISKKVQQLGVLPLKSWSMCYEGLNSPMVGGRRPLR